MKKLLSIVFGLAVLGLTSCTLYMDDEDAPIRDEERTGEGYDQVEEIVLPYGEVKYKYNQNTIAVTEDVENYILEVVDSTVYFAENTPDMLLPRVGEMLARGKCKAFPNGVGHKVVSRVKEGNRYRCELRQVDLFDLFDELEVKAAFTSIDAMPDTVRIDSITAYYSDTDLSQLDSYMEAEDGPESRATYNDPEWYNKTWWVDWKDTYGDGNLLAIGLNFEGGVKVAPVSAVSAGAYLNVGGNVHAGPIMTIDIDKSKHTKLIDMAVVVGIDAHFGYKVQGKIKVPLVTIPILGPAADFLVFNFKAGIDAKPYIQIDATLQGGVDFDYSVGLSIGYEQNSKYPKGHAYCKKKVFSKNGDDPATCSTSNNLKDPSLTLGVELGVDFEAGIGLNVLTAGAEAALVFSVYAHTDFPLGEILTMSSFQSKLDAEQKLQVDAELKVTLEGGAVVKFDKSLSFAKIKLLDLTIPYFPRIDEKKLSFYRSGHSGDGDFPTFTYNLAFNQKGLVNLLFDLEPWVYITDEKGSVIKKTKLTSSSLIVDKTYTTTISDNKIKDNVQYKAVPYIKVTKTGLELPYTPQTEQIISRMPSLKAGAYLAQSQRGAFKRKVVVNNALKERTYKYKYRLRVQVDIDNPQYCKYWGVDILYDYDPVNGKWGPGKEFGGYHYFARPDSKESAKSATIDYYVYSMYDQEQAYFTPYIYLGDLEKKQKLNGFYLKFNYDPEYEQNDFGDADMVALQSNDY